MSAVCRVVESSMKLSCFSLSARTRKRGPFSCSHSPWKEAFRFSVESEHPDVFGLRSHGIASRATQNEKHWSSKGLSANVSKRLKGNGFKRIPGSPPVSSFDQFDLTILQAILLKGLHDRKSPKKALRPLCLVSSLVTTPWP